MEPMGSVRPLEAVLLREGPSKTHQGFQRLLMDISQPIENCQMSQTSTPTLISPMAINTVRIRLLLR